MITVKFLNYLLDKEKMIREFKFFHGITIQTEGIQNIVRTLRAQWRPQPLEELNEIMGLDVAGELSRLLSEEIAREVDEGIIRQITTDWNGAQRA
jgi:hypothetical protein